MCQNTSSDNKFPFFSSDTSAVLRHAYVKQQGTGRFVIVRLINASWHHLESRESLWSAGTGSVTETPSHRYPDQELNSGGALTDAMWSVHRLVII